VPDNVAWVEYYDHQHRHWMQIKMADAGNEAKRRALGIHFHDVIDLHRLLRAHLRRQIDALRLEVGAQALGTQLTADPAIGLPRAARPRRAAGLRCSARKIPRAWSKLRSIQLRARTARREGGGHRPGKVRDLGGPSMIGGRLVTVESVRLDARLLFALAASEPADLDARNGWFRLEEVGVRRRLQLGASS
jgi:hypothetical protein